MTDLPWRLPSAIRADDQYNAQGRTYRIYRNGALQSELDNVWWPFQSVFNVHISVGFEWGSFRTKKGVPLGLFFWMRKRFKL